MLGRPLIMTGLLGAAVAAPIAMTEGPGFLDRFNTTAESSAPPAEPGFPATPPTPGAAPLNLPAPDGSSPRGPGSEIYASPAPLEGVGVLSLRELFRMDATRAWVYSRWARKSTGLADPELFGIRAPVVTGTQMTDLAGSISYYFNRQDQLDRIRFHGRTADTTQIVALCQRQFGMSRQTPQIAGEQLYQAKHGEQVISELRTQPAPVLWATAPHSSFVVDLEINRADSGRFVEQRRPKLQIPQAASPPQQHAAAPTGPPTTAPAASGEQAEQAGLQHAQRPTFRWPN